jgi:hypothetical protein
MRRRRGRFSSRRFSSILRLQSLDMPVEVAGILRTLFFGLHSRFPPHLWLPLFGVQWKIGNGSFNGRI